MQQNWIGHDANSTDYKRRKKTLGWSFKLYGDWSEALLAKSKSVQKNKCRYEPNARSYVPTKFSDF